ncbi:MAG: A24 family peptidase [Firmicutes bacterium]|jgi:prepilin signal peptidase PulO-like enzyme (type II secretory pathway)|nr:A24 family peptidase [Bacillota bacterium]MCL5064359.1 A24 family peptidase [Bacillota bacterium]
MNSAFFIDAGLALVLVSVLPFCGGQKRWPMSIRLAAGLLCWLLIRGLQLSNPHPWADALLVSVWVAVAFVDWREQIIPHRLVLASAMAGVIWTWSSGLSVFHHVISGLALGLAMTLLHGLTRSAVGMGDAKFSGTLGVALGWMRGAIAVSLSVWMAGILALALILLKRRPTSHRLAFAPFLSLSAFWLLLIPASHPIIHW